MKYIFLLFTSIIVFWGCNTPTYEITCKTDRDCDLGQTCNVTTSSCVQNRTECKKNADCPPGKSCNLNNNKCEVPTSCTTNESCYTLFPDEWDKDTRPAKCNSAKKCVLDACVENIDCIAGKVCQGGACVTPVSCDLVGSVKIITPSIVLKEGKEDSLKAQVFNKNGLAVVVEDGKITWQSSDSDIVSVDSNGNIKGGTKSGIAQITASHDDCSQVSAPVEIENFANLENGKLRVILRDLYTGKPASGVEIIINNSAPLVTDSKGWIETDNSESKNNILIKSDNYQYLSVLDTASKDIILYLTPFVPQDKAGGYQGRFNFDKVKNSGDLKIGIAGASLPSTLLDISFDFLLSESYMKDINAGGISGTYAVPSNIVMILGDDIVQENYRVTTPKGNIAYWGLGSKMSMSDFLVIIQSVMGSEGLNMGDLIRELAPYLKTFYHALKTENQTTLCSKIIDTTDSNGNGETDDLIPAYNNSSCFPEFNLKLEKKLSLASTIKNPKLLKLDNEFTDTAIAILGYNVDGNGFIPAGLTIGADKKDKDDTADQLVSDMILNYTPRYNGMEGANASLVLLAMKFEKDEENSKGLKGKSQKADEEEPPRKIRLSGLLKNYNNGIPAVMDFSQANFLKTTDDATFNAPTVNFNAVPDANIYRLKIKSVTGKILIIYTNKTNFDIPSISDFGDIEFILIQAVTASKSIDEIVLFNDNNLNKFTDFVTAFSVFEL